MGDVSDATTKKKKKGRPSLLDLQKRSLKKQQNHNSHSNLHHQNDDDDERTQKKQKLLIRLNSHHSFNSTTTPSNTRNIHHQTDGKVLKAIESKDGSQCESGPTTPLPDKKLLLFILDRLQKKDTHDVFSEPVDPEELPDYHDIIKNPMDFGTVRNKLDGGLYANLETFENDVFLICSNAMQYNSPDTIYHRQARAMQEIAKKDFENLRQETDSDSEPQPKPQHKIVQRGRPPGKNIIKSLTLSPSDRVGPESSSDATLASGRDIASGSNVYNLRKALSKFQPADSSVRASHSNLNSGGYTNWSYDWENEFPASVLKAVLRYGKKQSVVDETKRDTYNNPVAFRNQPPLLATVEDELKQLLAVGLHVKHSYARSLAHFAADLGPVAWKIAARKISSVLPRGHEYGPGWVAEDNASQKQHFPACDDEKTSGPPVPEDYKSSFLSPSGSLPVENRPFLQSGDMVMNREFNYQNDSNPVNNAGGGIESMVPLRMQQESMVRSDDFGSNCRPGSNFSPQMKMVRLADLTGSTSSGNVPQMLDMDSISSHMAPANINQPLRGQFLNNPSQLHSINLLPPESGFESQSLSQGLAGKPSWQGMEVPTNQSSFPLANDLNRKIVATNSGSSNVENGSQRQPNLALQL
ncbi:PREDICTED: uncharacterized protein LOC109344002 isoform X2 [Lupinus angustifolius]|uniref:uncharacterized protein LOC109344002 isoform X2 n=1 Tax=Lupinus angustifolius TaxID=3871 RepID=UPI00092EE9B2|nr:PREDICTED: uncharacterized protein LOC109344002 isoform X2 [Lupinus angustifolius]